MFKIAIRLSPCEIIDNAYLVRRRPKALQDRCFEVIALQFHTVLSKSTEKNIDFLKRKSQLLLKKFKDLQCTVFLPHATFCLNRHLKRLHLHWFKEWDIPTIVNELATMENRLTILSVQTDEDILMDVFWQLIRSLPVTLECLSLSFTNCVDDMLEIVSQRCPGLHELYLDNCDSIHDMGVMALCSKNEKGDLCPNEILQKLDLTSTKVTENGLAIILKNFPNLIELHHSDLEKVLCEMYCEASLNNGLSKKYNLKVLSLDPVGFPDYYDLKSFTTLCPYVTKLKITIFNQAMLKICEDFVSLNDVYLDVREYCDLSPFFKARGRALKSLALFADFPISLVTLVKSCPELEYLHLQLPKFTKTKSKSDSQYVLHRLTEVEICVSNLDNLEKSMSYLLSQCPNLEMFTLQNMSESEHPFCVNSLFKYMSMSTLNELEVLNVNVNIPKILSTMRNFQVKSYCS